MALPADDVSTDYSELFGDPSATVRRDALVEQWQGLLPGFDATSTSPARHPAAARQLPGDLQRTPNVLYELSEGSLKERLCYFLDHPEQRRAVAAELQRTTAKYHPEAVVADSPGGARRGSTESRVADISNPRRPGHPGSAGNSCEADLLDRIVETERRMAHPALHG